MVFSNRIAASLCKISTEMPESSYRQGTCIADKGELVKALGEPNAVDHGDDKVTIAWHISTPRGPVTVRDYWWNAKNEWSIASGNGAKACQWAIRFLRSLGFQASTKIRM